MKICISQRERGRYFESDKVICSCVSGDSVRRGGSSQSDLRRDCVSETASRLTKTIRLPLI